MTQEKYNHISRYTRHFFSGTMLSRISGMFRDICMASIFGDHPSVAAFMVAFRFSHFLRRLLGEGGLQAIFIPNYEELRLKDERKANGFFFRLNILLIALLIVIIVAVEIGVNAKLFSDSFTEKEVSHLFSWMFPSLIFISLYGLNISLLQCHNSFFLSSMAPLACNLIWLLAIFIFAKKDPSEAMVGLAVFTLAGFMVQWLITLPKTWKNLREGMRNYDAPIFSLTHEIKRIGKATLFGMVGITAVQINSFLDMLFARYADLKGPIYLWYAIRLEQLPLAVVGFACVSSIVPSLSRLIKANDLDKAQELFFFGYKRIFWLVTTCTFAIFALGFASVNILFGRGHFSPNAVIETTWCLWAYGLGLLPSTLIIYQSSLFYAYDNYKMPALASLSSVTINILLNALFVFIFHWGAVSIALSTALSAWINYWILKRTFSQKRYWDIQYLKISNFWKLLTVGLAAGLCCSILDKCSLSAFFFQYDGMLHPRSFPHQLLHFLGQFVSFTAIFALGLFLTCKEMFYGIKNLTTDKL